jgi:sarcosine oxidase subunit alpha
MMVAGLWLRPEHYGDPTAEVRAVRTGVGLIDVSTLGKLKFTGPGVSALLERLYVNRWRKLGVGRVRYGLMCNDEGVVLDDGVTARLAEAEWYTTTTSSGAETIFEWIQWWAQSGWGEGAHITNVTEDFAAFNLTGPRAREVLANLTTADISPERFHYMHALQAEVAGVPCTILRIGFTGELSFEIHCPTGFGLHVWEALIAAGEAFDIRPFGVEAQRVLRLEKGHIIIGQDTDATSDPLSADQAWVVKLDKDDFLGRRALTQVSETGLRQRLVGFTMAKSDLVPDEGLLVVNPGQHGQHRIVGWVTSSRFSPTLWKALGLCWLPAEVAGQAGATFHIYMDGRLEEASVHHGPFYDPEGKRLRG